MTFPDSMQSSSASAAPPDNLRTELLRLGVVYLQANPISAANRESVCNGVVSFIAPVLPQFQRLLPQQADVARQAVLQCQPANPLARQRLDDALRYRPPDTVDELLKAADAATDTKVRAVYSYRAAALAKEQNDLDHALKILDGMSLAEREFMGVSWEAYRWEWGSLAALKYFKSGDVSMMHLTSNAVPADLQPFAKLAFVSGLPSPGKREADPTAAFLDEAREGLRRSAIFRWVQCYAPEINRRMRPHLKMGGASYRLDEPYVKVGTEWKYLYRAVDSAGQTIEFMLSAKRDVPAAERFFKKLIRADHRSLPFTTGTGKHASYPQAFATSVKEKVLPSDCKLRRVEIPQQYY